MTAVKSESVQDGPKPGNMDLTGRELVFMRQFDAPRELVYQVWTSPEHLTHWWGPDGFSTTVLEMNVRPGGVFRLVMHSPNGTDYKNRIVFTEVTAAEQLVYRHAGEGDDEDVNFETTVTFANDRGGTNVTMRMLFSSMEERERVIRKYHADEGGRQTLNRLARTIANIQKSSRHHGGNASEPIPSTEAEFVITRIFDAPRELVFKAFTEPEHFVKWWGPYGFTTPHCRIDPRPGGKIHFCMRSPEGADYWGAGDFLEFVPPERLVYTDHFSDEAGNVVAPSVFGMGSEWPVETVDTITFEESRDGMTKMTLRMGVSESLAKKHGASEGWNQSFDKLDEYLVVLR